MPDELAKPLTSSVGLPNRRTLADRVARGMLRLENALFEHRLGISTHGVHNWTPGDWSQTEHLYYYATSYRRIFRILDSLRLGPSDTFIDLGCGKGRVICCASRYPVSQVIGIEDVAELCQLAENNLRLLRGKRSPATILHTKAEEFPYASGTVIYMFHSFGPNTLAAVLSRLQRALRLNPRQVRIVYVNPVHESVLAQTDWLEMYDRWSPRGRFSTNIIHAVSFWRLRGC